MSVATFASDYNSIVLKAQRFYDQREWASASAMLDLMLDERPDNPCTYSRAIVSAAMRSDTLAQLSLMDKAMGFHVPFDSIFTMVQKESFAVGQGSIYEDFMERMKRTQPWMSRSIDAYLLRYYTFRRNPAKMIEYSKIMLAGMPDETAFLSTLAQGYMLNNCQDDAVETYRKILKIKPNDYNTLLELGNYFYLKSKQNPNDNNHQKDALIYLRQAENVRTTPYVANVIAELEKLQSSNK